MRISEGTTRMLTKDSIFLRDKLINKQHCDLVVNTLLYFTQRGFNHSVTFWSNVLSAVGSRDCHKVTSYRGRTLFCGGQHCLFSLAATLQVGLFHTTSYLILRFILFQTSGPSSPTSCFTECPPSFAKWPKNRTWSPRLPPDVVS